MIEAFAKTFLIREEGLMAPQPINFADTFNRLPSGDYAMGIIATMNNYEFKIVRFKGDFTWHSHPDTDETFIILSGEMALHFREGVVKVRAGEMIVIPKGVEHKPASKEGYQALLIEPEGVPNTGDAISAQTIETPSWV